MEEETSQDIWISENKEELIEDFLNLNEEEFNKYCEEEYNKVCDVEETNNSLMWNR